MGGKVIVILFLVVALGIGLYLVRSGAVGKLTSGVDYLANLRRSSSTQAESNSSTAENSFFGTGAKFEPIPPPRPGPEQAPAGSPRTPLNASNVEQPPPPPPANEEIPSYDIPEGFTRSQLSPYFHKIRLGPVYPGSDFSEGLVSLYANFSEDGNADVFGWRLQARNGSQIVPQAVDIYDPSGLAAESDVRLRSGDVLNMYSGTSAIGLNLHLNKCLGFLENTNNFTPSIPRNCPSVDRREISNFSGECQDYIMSLGSCDLPDPSPPISPNDDDCRTYLNTINYKSCFDRYRFDPDFLSREWWAWTGSRFLDERHDKLSLLDRQGFLVDYYEY